MSAAPITAVPGPSAPAPSPATPARVGTPALVRRLALRLSSEWLPRAVWTLSRTGRAGLVGIATIAAAALFLVSTHLEVVGDVRALRAELAAAASQARPVAGYLAAAPTGALRALPARTDVPAVLSRLFNEASRARLAVDTAKYETSAMKSGGVVRYRIAFPVTGPYPQVRAFIDATLATMPAVGISDLVLQRSSIGASYVEAQMRMTIYADGSTTRASLAPQRQQPSDAVSAALVSALTRVVAPTHAPALFAPHSWYVQPPPRPPPPPPAQPPPPDPTAPPFPYTFVGSFAPEGDQPVYFLSRGDRVIDARVGDRLDGVYQFESASGGQLVFVYLPLNIRQSLAGGVTR